MLSKPIRSSKEVSPSKSPAQLQQAERWSCVRRTRLTANTHGHPASPGHVKTLHTSFHIIAQRLEDANLPGYHNLPFFGSAVGRTGLDCNPVQQQANRSRLQFQASCSVLDYAMSRSASGTYLDHVTIKADCPHFGSTSSGLGRNWGQFDLAANKPDGYTPPAFFVSRGFPE